MTMLSRYARTTWRAAFAAVAVVWAGIGATTARAQATEPFLGEIILVGFNFCPVGWAPANGQIMSIAQNTALFSLLGTFYGGDGIQTFALPDLRGRVPIGNGQGPGLQNYSIGQLGGEEAHTLTTAEIPPHTHGFSLMASSTHGSQSVPTTGAALASSAGGDRQFTLSLPNTAIAGGTTLPAGSGLPHNNMQPYLAMTYCIAVNGVFPSRP